MTKKILFVCTGNSARSQMAEGFTRHYGKGLIEASSAGLEPKGVNPLAIKVMAEKQVDISSQTSKALDLETANEMDLAITVCSHAESRCPAFSLYVKRLHWPIEDPVHFTGTEEEVLEQFRKVRDEIEENVQALIEELKKAP